MGNYKVEKFGINTERRNYQKTTNNLKELNLLDIQIKGFNKFIEQGINEVLKEIYPIISTNERIKVEYISSKIELPKNIDKEILEAKRAGLNYDGKITAEFKLTNNVTGDIKREKNVYLAKLPLMTPGGSFIINGSERIIISQIVRAPGAYFENMKASRVQSLSDDSVYKVASIIPNRGA
jgi:DNA-directed RNA polymerase subunit beta